MAIPQQCAEQPHYGRGTWTRTREMAGSKPAALPLGYTPIKYKGAFVRQRALLYENKTACQQNKKNKFTSQNLFRTESTNNDDLYQLISSLVFFCQL